MKAKVAALAGAALLLGVNVNLAANVENAAQTFAVTVNAADNIYGAVSFGCAGSVPDAPCGGYLPPGIAVSGGETLTFSVPHTQMIKVNDKGGDNQNNADGVGAAVSTSSNTGYGSLSGITAPHGGYLVGVFVPAGGPKGSAPPALDFVKKGTSFTSLSPLLNQVFFIGDGLTGNGTGTKQIFRAPSGAAMLYLGLSDACGYNGPPGCFNDNIGFFNVTITAGLAVVQPTLTPGTYNVSALIARVNQLSGNYCFPSGQNFFGSVSSFYITYNGAEKAAAATVPVPAIPAFESSPQAGPFMALLTLPSTPKAGNAWNGTSSELLQPLNVRFSRRPFAATLNIVNPLSFAGTMTLNDFSPGVPPDNIGNFCDVTLQYSAAFVGPVN